MKIICFTCLLCHFSIDRVFGLEHEFQSILDRITTKDEVQSVTPNELIMKGTGDLSRTLDDDGFGVGSMGNDGFGDSIMKKQSSSQNCDFEPQPLNPYNQFETDLIEGVTDGVIGLASASAAAVMGPLGAVLVATAGSVVAGQLSARYATDPNEDRFTALETFSSCVESEFNAVWNALEELADRMKESEYQRIKEFFEVETAELQRQKHVLLVDEMTAIDRCLESNGSSFTPAGSECGKDEIKDVTEDIFQRVVLDFGRVVDKAAILYEDLGKPKNRPYDSLFPMFGDRVKLLNVELANVENNGGFHVEPKLKYDDMRTFLDEITYQANTVTLMLTRIRDWATARGLYRNEYVYDVVWNLMIHTVEFNANILQTLIDSLMHSSPEHGSLPVQRIMTSDRYAAKVFCVNWLVLKSDAPDWCQNKDPDGWTWDDNEDHYGSPETGRCSNDQTRGCWIGDGDCSLENFRNTCVDWLASNPGDSHYHSICELNSTPSLPVDNNNYADAGPLSWAYSIDGQPVGAPIDPLLDNIIAMRTAVAYCKAFASYWKKEREILQPWIFKTCEKETLDLGSPGEYTFVACPQPPLCIRCNGSEEEKACPSRNVTDATMCGSDTYPENLSNGCFCEYREEWYMIENDCNRRICGYDRVQTGSYWDWRCFCTRYTYEDVTRCCDHGPYSRYVLETCTFPKTCTVQEECICEAVECE